MKKYISLENGRVSGFHRGNFDEAIVSRNGFQSVPEDFDYENRLGQLYDPNTAEFTDDEEAQNIREQKRLREEERKNRKPKVSPTQFKLLLTREERISLRGAVETDPGIADLFDLVDDPRTSSIDLNLSSVQEAIDYALNFLEGEGVVTDVVTRKEEILSG